jgi:hypothetical protein
MYLPKPKEAPVSLVELVIVEISPWQHARYDGVIVVEGPLGAILYYFLDHSRRRLDLVHAPPCLRGRRSPIVLTLSMPPIKPASAS